MADELDGLKDQVGTMAGEVAALVQVLSQSEDIKGTEHTSTRWWLRLIGLGLVALAGGGTFAGYELVRAQPTPEDTARAVEQVNDRTEKIADESNERVEVLERKVERLGDRSIEAEVQIVDGLDHIANKIDAAHPRQRDAVAEPESLKAGRKRVDKIKRAKAVDELFKDIDADDPLKDLDK